MIKTKKEKICFGLFIITSILTAIVFAVNRSLNGDFIAYNGDFQNYNIFRRILDGQAQYSDFLNYLGVGGVYINIPFIFLFNNFGASIFITNFSTSILFSIVIFTLLHMIFRDYKKSFLGSSCISILCFVFLHLEGYGVWFYKYIYNVAFIEELGHSMRTTRGFLPYLLVLLYFLTKKIVKKDMEELWGKKRYSILVGLVLGFFITWSNDFGYSSIICYFIISLIVLKFYKKYSWKNRILWYCLFSVGVASGALINIALITKGDIVSYFSTTKGITSYQFWYYQNVPGKYCTVFDFFSDKLFLALTLVFFVYSIWCLFSLILHRFSETQILLWFIYSTNYVAALVYVFGSGHHNYYLLQLVTYFIILYCCREIYMYIKEKNIIRECKSWLCIKNKIKNFKWKSVAFVCVYSLIMICSYLYAITYIKGNLNDNNKQRIEALNINTIIGNDLEEICSELGDETLFSTYASAIESINSLYQPTGIDYIIHVLGDENRREYLTNFTENNYKYVSTLKNDYSTWEYWVVRANWFFYRELYKNYSPKMQSNYSIIWEKTDQEQSIDTDVKVEVTYIDSINAKVSITLPEYYDDCYVDLKISYDTEWTENRLKELALRKCIAVYDGGEIYNVYNANQCYYLDESEDEYFIPVYVTSGKKEIYISSNPSCTKLVGLQVKSEQVLRTPEFPLCVANYTDIDMLVSDAVSLNTLKFVNTEVNLYKLQNASTLISNGKSVDIDNMYVSNGYIYVNTTQTIPKDDFKYPNNVVCNKTYAVENITDKNWVAGIKRDQAVLLFDKRINTQNLSTIRYGDRMVNVESIEDMQEYNWIFLEDSENVQYFSYPAKLELIYR